MPIEIPEIRQQGTGVDRTWQWKFRDGAWRDMSQDLSRGTVKTYKKSTEPKNKLQQWWSSYSQFAHKVLPGADERDAYGVMDVTEVPGDIVDFDALIEKTDILPEYLQGNISSAYMLTLGGLWAEVTGYNPELGEYQPGASWNFEARRGSQEMGGAGAWNEAVETEIDNAVLDIASDLSDTYGWENVARTRGYNIDWSEDMGAAAFLNQTQVDVEKGKKYTGTDSRADIVGGGTAEPFPDVTTDPRTDAVTEGSDTATGRKVVATASSESQASMMAGQIDGATVEPTADGKFAITVAPGQGGWGTKEAAQSWLNETSGDTAGNFEVVPGTEGQWYVREKAKDAGGQFNDRAAAEKWLTDTGAGDNFEAVPGPEGKWTVREKPRDLRYSTGDLPGDMFRPQVIEDPTGQRFGISASGAIEDMGYGFASEMAQTDYTRGGDIAEAELAGYQVPSRSLDAIIAKAIERGNWELARGVQAFKDRPTERDLLDYAAQYAESPADLAVLSSIARGEQMVQPAVPLPEGMGTGMGQATRIGAPGEVYSKAYSDFLSAMDQGYMPNQQELEELFDPTKDPAYIETQKLVEKYEGEMKTMREAMEKSNQDATARIEANQTKTMDLITGTFKEALANKDTQFNEMKSNFETLLGERDQKLAEVMKGISSTAYHEPEALDDSGSGSSGSSSGYIGIGKQAMTLIREWEKAHPGQLLMNMPGFREATNTSVDAQLAWLQTDANWPSVSVEVNSEGNTVIVNPNANEGDGSNTEINKDSGDTVVKNASTGATIISTTFAEDPTPIGGIPEGGFRRSFGDPSKDLSQITAQGDDYAQATGFGPGSRGYQTDYTGDDYMVAGGPSMSDLPLTELQRTGLSSDIDQYTGPPPSIPSGTRVGSASAIPTATPTAGVTNLAAGQAKAGYNRDDLMGNFDPNWEFEGAEGGVVQGPTMALLGEKEPEFIVPFSKVDEFKKGFLPLGPSRQTPRGSTVANFTDSIPRFANGGVVTGPRFGGVTARELVDVGGSLTTPQTLEELRGGAYGGDISKAPRIASSDFESLLTRYADPESRRYLREGTTDLGQQGYRDTATRNVQMGNIPEYELRQRLGASEFAATNPAQHPIGIQQLMAGRPISRPRSLMTAANMPTPSGQALRNMLPSERAYYQKMGRMAGIPEAELEQEMRAAMPGGTRRTPLRMGARRVRQA